MKLISRYNQISLPVILGLFLLSGLGIYILIDNILVADFDDSLLEQSQKIAAYILKNNTFPKPGFADEWHINIQQNNNNREIIPYYATQKEFDEEDKAFVSYRSLTFSCIKNNKRYIIIISKSMEALGGLSRSIALISVITLLSVIIATLLLNHFLLKKLWKPFYNTLNLLKDFKLGSYQKVFFEKTRTDEFDFMNEQVNSMMHSAEKDYVLLKEFTENASHELQTPLSIIRSKLDLIIQGENLSDAQSRAMESAYQGISRLVNLNQSLLLLSKIENHQFNDKSRINLKDKINDKLFQLEEFWLEKKLTVHADINEAYIFANPNLIDILLNNALSNASRHNILNGNITISLTNSQLIISNTGLNSSIDPARIFSRFYKREQHSSNNGLGLSIIKQICDQADILVNYTFQNNQHSFSFTWSPIENITTSLYS
jgi:signal transduction histidine kinase